MVFSVTGDHSKGLCGQWASLVGQLGMEVQDLGGGSLRWAPAMATVMEFLGVEWHVQQALTWVPVWGFSYGETECMWKGMV